MKFPNNKKIFIEYLIYILSIALQILIILASAKFLTDEAFVKFNVYIAFINIGVIVINCATLNYLMINTNDRLSPMIFENLSALLILPISIILLDENYITIFFIFTIVILKLNLNLYCRHFLVNNKLTESLLYNFFGNSIWIVFAIIYYLIWKKITINTLFSIWIIILVVTCFFYLINNSIKLKFNKISINRYVNFYLKNFHFSFLFPSYLNFERIVFFKVFSSIGLLATYTIFTKIINLTYEFTSGFIIQKKIGKNFKINNIYIFISIIFINIIFFKIYNISYFNNLIADIFSGKIHKSHEGILPFVIINLTFYGFLRLLYVDMVKTKKFKNIFYIVLAIYSSFIFIILLKPSMHISLLIESFLIAIACLYSYHLSIHDTKISNK